MRVGWSKKAIFASFARYIFRTFTFKATFIIMPPGTTVPDGLMFYRRCFLFFIFSPRFLRDPSTDRPETLRHGRHLAEFYILTSKIRRYSPKKFCGPKTCEISVNFGPLQTLIANISGIRQHIQKRKDVRSRKIPPAFNGKSPLNFGPLTAWNYM